MPAPYVTSVHQGTMFWHPPVEVAQFWHLSSGFGDRFRLERPNKNKFLNMKLTSNLNHFQQLLFHTFPRLLINIISSQKKGRQNRS